MKITAQEIPGLLRKISDNTPENIQDHKHIIITGPSGSGKTSIIREEKNGIISIKPWFYSFSVSAMTRDLRKNEIQGVDYTQMTVDEFLKTPMIEDNAYVGNGKLYGTTMSEVLRITIHEKKRMVLDLDINGGYAVKNIFTKDAFFVFLNTPEKTLFSRLKKRQHLTGETDAQIEARIEASRVEKRRIKTEEIKPDFILDYDDSITPGMAANVILLESFRASF